MRWGAKGAQQNSLKLSECGITPPKAAKDDVLEARAKVRWTQSTGQLFRLN